MLVRVMRRRDSIAVVVVGERNLCRVMSDDPRVTGHGEELLQSLWALAARAAWLGLMMSRAKILLVWTVCSYAKNLFQRESEASECENGSLV